MADMSQLSPNPVSQSERVIAIDALRGLAVLGILLVNIQAFAMPAAAYVNPPSFGDFSGWNYAAWYATYLLASAKFMTIFSLLFGAGIVIMSDRARVRGASGTAIHYRRMIWLILFGLLHAHLLWYGDILYFYGMCGLFVWPMRKMPTWLLLTIGFAGIAIASALSLGFALAYDQMPLDVMAEFKADWSPPAEAVAQEIAAYRGSWLDQMEYRVPTALEFETVIFLVYGIGRAGGLMLVGIALYRLGVLTAARSKAFYALAALVGFGVGLPAIAVEISLTERAGWRMDSMLLYSQINYWVSMLVAGGWLSIVMLWHKLGGWPVVRRALASTGQMALTNYLMQTIICTTIFYGHGLGYFGAWSRAEQFALVLGVWLLCLVVSPLWLARFRFGPFEWLWRSLTYWRWQPMVRAAA
jgi:uncharacterized protein